MRQISDNEWAQIQELQDGEFPKPVPGGYIGYIVRYEDVEHSNTGKDQYLRLWR